MLIPRFATALLLLAASSAFGDESGGWMEDKESGFKIRVPTGWTARPADPEKNLVARFQDAKEQGALEVYVRKGLMIDARALATQMEHVALGKVPYMQRRLSTKGHALDLRTDAIVREYAGELDGKPLRCFVLYTCRNYRGYMVFGIYGELRTELYREVVEKAVRSFGFVEIAAAPATPATPSTNSVAKVYDPSQPSYLLPFPKGWSPDPYHPPKGVNKCWRKEGVADVFITAAWDLKKAALKGRFREIIDNASSEISPLCQDKLLEEEIQVPGGHGLSAIFTGQFNKQDFKTVVRLVASKNQTYILRGTAAAKAGKKAFKEINSILDGFQNTAP